MRHTEILCHQCVYPHALDYCQTRAAVPPFVHGEVADHMLHCTRCGDEIPAGRGYVLVEGAEPVEEIMAISEDPDYDKHHGRHANP